MSSGLQPGSAEQFSLRSASVEDLEILTVFKQQLIVDERHESQASREELRDRMRRWIAGMYSISIIENTDGEPVAFATWRDDEDGVYLRQLFVARQHRRLGVGRAALTLLALEWAGRPVRLDVLMHNDRAIAFYRSVGFADYSIGMRRQHSDPPALAGGPGTP